MSTANVTFVKPSSVIAAALEGPGQLALEPEGLRITGRRPPTVVPALVAGFVGLVGITIAAIGILQYDLEQYLSPKGAFVVGVVFGLAPGWGIYQFLQRRLRGATRTALVAWNRFDLLAVGNDRLLRVGTDALAGDVIVRGDATLAPLLAEVERRVRATRRELAYRLALLMRHADGRRWKLHLVWPLLALVGLLFQPIAWTSVGTLAERAGLAIGSALVLLVPAVIVARFAFRRVPPFVRVVRERPRDVCWLALETQPEPRIRIGTTNGKQFAIAVPWGIEQPTFDDFVAAFPWATADGSPEAKKRFARDPRQMLRAA